MATVKELRDRMVELKVMARSLYAMLGYDWTDDRLTMRFTPQSDYFKVLKQEYNDIDRVLDRWAEEEQYQTG